MQQKRCENLIKVRSQIWTGSDHLKITTPPTNSLKKIKYIKNYWLERSGASDAYSCIFERWGDNWKARKAIFAQVVCLFVCLFSRVLQGRAWPYIAEIIPTPTLWFILPRFQSNLKQKCKQKSNDLYFFEYFYPRVYVVYRWVYILLGCCCCCWTILPISRPLQKLSFRNFFLAGWLFLLFSAIVWSQIAENGRKSQHNLSTGKKKVPKWQFLEGSRNWQNCSAL
jgi:hypothetical protein